ncbi:hypothetical protein [Rhizobium sp. LEGMi135b]
MAMIGLGMQGSEGCKHLFVGPLGDHGVDPEADLRLTNLREYGLGGNAQWFLEGFVSARYADVQESP